MRLIKQVLVISSRQDEATNLKHIATTWMLLVTKLDRIVTYLGGLLPIKSYGSLIIWSCKFTWQTKTVVSLLCIATVRMTTKLGRMLTNLQVLPPMLLIPLVTWSYWIMWQTKTIISPLPLCLSPPNFVGVWPWGAI